ncbi:hypothetical protein TNCV_2259401 [Trichonephila clavipes]|nr:hypothetical protein TNCV_2259401 [Trichonephila clavipes]
MRQQQSLRNAMILELYYVYWSIYKALPKDRKVQHGVFIVDVHQEEKQIRFMFVKDVKPAEIIRRMQDPYGASCLSESDLRMYRSFQASLCFDKRTGSPSTSTSEDKDQVVEGILME